MEVLNLETKVINYDDEDFFNEKYFSDICKESEIIEYDWSGVVPTLKPNLEVRAKNLAGIVAKFEEQAAEASRLNTKIYDDKVAATAAAKAPIVLPVSLFNFDQVDIKASNVINIKSGIDSNFRSNIKSKSHALEVLASKATKDLTVYKPYTAETKTSVDLTKNTVETTSSAVKDTLRDYYFGAGATKSKLDLILESFNVVSTPKDQHLIEYRKLLTDTCSAITTTKEYREILTELISTIDCLDTGSDVSDEFKVIIQKIQNKQEPEKGAFGLVNLEDMLKDTTPIQWEICGLLQESSLNLMSGQYEYGKSFIALDMAFCIASGMDYHGIKVKQQPVVYIVGEGLVGYINRIIALMIGYKVGHPKNFHFSTSCANFTYDTSTDNVEKIVRGLYPTGTDVLIIVDTLNRNFGGADEHSTQHMSQFVHNLDRCFKQETVLVVHHAGHGDKGRARCSIVMPASCEGEFIVKKSSPGNFELKCINQKDGEEHDPMFFTSEKIILDTKRSDGWPEDSLFLSLDTDKK